MERHTDRQTDYDSNTALRTLSAFFFFFQQLVKVDSAVACTSRRHAALSCARRFAVARPRFSGRRSVFNAFPVKTTPFYDPPYRQRAAARKKGCSANRHIVIVIAFTVLGVIDIG